MALDELGPVVEEDAHQLEREEAEVEVSWGEESEERVERGGRGEEDVRVAKARVVADRLRSGRTSAGRGTARGTARHAWRGQRRNARMCQLSYTPSAQSSVRQSAYPSVLLLDLAQEAQRLNHRLGNLQILGRVLLQHAQQDRQCARPDLLRGAQVPQHHPSVSSAAVDVVEREPHANPSGARAVAREAD